MMQYTSTTGAYLITSHGNGWAYEITEQSTGRSLWFQDNDATTLEAETDNLENDARIGDYFDLLED